MSDPTQSEESAREPAVPQQSEPECEHDTSEETQGGAPGRGESGVVFLETDAAERERLGALGEALGCPVTVVAPEELTPEVLASFCDARAVVVDWELGGRPGLDLVEHLTRSEATRDVPVAAASVAPTRGRVAAALRAGARTFLLKPCEPEEIRTRLLEPPSAPESQAGSNEAPS